MSQLEFENIDGKKNGDGKKYKVEAICNSKVYIKESGSSYLSDLPYLIL